MRFTLIHLAPILLTGPSYALVEVSRTGTVAQNEYQDDDLKNVSNTAYRNANDLPEKNKNKVNNLEKKFGLKSGSLRADARSGRIATINPDVPLLPGTGKGNRLLWSVGTGGPDGDHAHGPPSDLSDTAKQATMNWMVDNEVDLDIDVAREVLARSMRAVAHSGGNQGQEGSDSIQVRVDRTFKGIPVIGSAASAFIKKGNLIMFSLEQWGSIPENTSVTPKLTGDEAAQQVADHAGFALDDGEDCKQELMILPLANGNVPPAHSQGGQIRGTSANDSEKSSNGYKHSLVWKVCPRLQGQGVESLQAYVNAQTGKILEFKDTVEYLVARGDVYPLSNDGQAPNGLLQADWPMPFMYIDGSQTTDSGGNFPFGITSATNIKYEGPYTRMNDNCGSTSLSSNEAEGNLDFGGSAGTNCDTPGFGGAGNTHSSRTGFYELNKMQEIARGYLPDNNWLQQQLTANMNINNNCNAYYSGTINFYRSGGGCGNTGEIAAIFDHEWGHGMDDNDFVGGIASPSGEGIADIYSALRLNDSCIGRGFFTDGSFCTNNGNPCTCDNAGSTCLNKCTGVRDINWENKQRNLPTTYTWSNANCGSSVHCIGYVYSEAIWDLYTRDLPAEYSYDSNTALELTQRLTYMAGGSTSTWFSGGPPYGGCGSNSGYLNFLAADDDDGNINNGTPHMTAIYNAFNRHEIACDTPSIQDSGCVGSLDLAAPTVTVTTGNTQLDLSWTPVAGAMAYQVFRTEGVHQCDQGKVLLTTTTATTYTSTGLMNGRDYSYVVIPKGDSDATSSCFGHSSNCVTEQPEGAPDFQLSCPDSVQISVDALSPETRVCTVYALYGYTGKTVSFSCSSETAGVECNVAPIDVTFAGETEKTTSITIGLTSAASAGEGLVTLEARDGTKVRSSPISVLMYNGQYATYDGGMGAPCCETPSSECSTHNLLKGRGPLGPEPNGAVNAIGSCSDGTSGTYMNDESLESITVKSLSGNDMAQGSVVIIEAVANCWSTGSADSADIYYTTTPEIPDWILIETLGCPAGGIQTLSTQYTIPENQVVNEAGLLNAVRVNFRYNGGQSSCSGGQYDEADDLVFAVVPDGQTSTPTANPTSGSPTTTSQPSKNPSSVPSYSPSTSAAPSETPTSSPTKNPTVSPTPAPTKNPTASPTFQPTKQFSCSSYNSQGGGACKRDSRCRWNKGSCVKK